MHKKIFRNYLFKVIIYLRLLFSNTLNYLITILLLPFLVKNNNISQSYLFINSLNLGDLIISLKFLAQHKKKFPFNAHCILINSKYVDLFKLISLDYEIIPWDKKRYKYNIFYRINLINSLRKRGFSTAYNISQERGILNDELTLMIGCKNKICFKKKAKYLFPFFNLLNILRYSKLLDFGEHNEYRILEIAAKKLNLINIPPIKNMFGEQICEGIPSNYVCVVPFSSNFDKNWPTDNYVHLVEKLSSNYNIVLLGEKDDHKFQSLSKHPHILNLMGKTKLSEAVVIIKNSQLFIGNDSGLTHLANVLDIPLIAIIGGGSKERFFQRITSTNKKFHYCLLDCFGCEWYCIYKERYCLTKVTVATILSDVYKILN